MQECHRRIRADTLSDFTVTDCPLAGLKVITRQKREDSRGFLSRIFCSESLRSAGWEHEVVQINHTWTAQRGTIRGMHYQLPPHAEMKLVCCIRGAVLDVAVDLRASSPTFLQWHAVELSANNNDSLLIPEGFAHGFQALSDDIEMLYLHSSAYDKDHEAGLNPLDKRIAIPWPLPPHAISQRDLSHPPLNGHFEGVDL